MSDDLIGRGVVEVVGDTDDVTAKISKVGDDVEKMARRAAKAGKEASDGINKIGDGAKKASEGMGDATSKFEANLKRQISSMSAAKRGTAEYIREQAKLKGADVNTLEPLIRQYESVKRNADAAAAATRRVGQSQRFLRDLESRAAGIGKTASQLAALKAEQLGVAKEAAPMIARMEQAERAANRTGGAFSQLSGYVRATVAAFGVRELVRYADSWTELQNRLRLVTGSQRDLASATDDVYRIAMTTNQELSATAEVYQRFAQNADALGLSQERVAEVTETVSKAVAVSGASAQAAQAALTQFGQALASGVLRGEEFNSVVEQTPALAQAIARGMGVAVGELRALASEGKITGDVLIEALSNARDSVDEQFSTRIVTLGQSFTNLGTAVTRYIGELNTSAGVTSTAGRLVEGLANNIDTLGTVAAAAGAIFAGRFVSSLVATNGGLVAIGRSAVVAATSIGAVGRAGALALGVLGGPVGMAVTAGLVAASFLAMGRDAKEASTDVDELTSALDGLTLAQLQSRKFKAEDLVSKRIAEFEEESSALQALQKDYEGLSRHSGVTAAELENVTRTVIEQEARVDAARQKLDEATQAQQRLEGAARSAAGGVQALNEALAGTNEAGAKYLERLADQSITAGLRTQREQLEAMVSAGKLVYSDADLAKARQYADHIDSMSQSMRGGARSATDMASAMRSLLDAHLPQVKAVEDLNKNLSLLQAAQRAGIVSGENYAKALESINSAYARQMKELLPESVKKAQEQAKAARDQTAVLQQQIRTFGLAESAVLQLAAADTRSAIAKLESQKAASSLNESSVERIAAIDAEIAALQELGELQIGMSALQAQVEWQAAERVAWESWSRDVEQIFQQVGQSLTDAIFEGGKSGRDLIKDLFKTLTLRVLINPVMNSIQGAVTNSLGSMFGLQNPQQGGVMGAANNLSSMNSIFGAGYQALTGASAGASTASLGYANLVGAFGGDSIGALISANGGWQGAMAGFGAAGAAGAGLAGVTAGSGLAASLGGTLGGTMATTGFSASLAGAGAAGAGAAGAGAAAGGLAGIGSAIGAALPWVGGALAIGSLLGGSDLFGGGPPKTRHGQRSTSEWIDGRIQLTGMDSRQSSESQAAAAQAAQAAVTQANALFTQLGIDAAFDSFYAIMESSVMGDRQGVASGGSLRIGDELRQVGIAKASDMTFAGFGGWSSADMLPRLATDVQMTVLEAFQQLGDTLPPALSGMLKDVSIRGLDEAGAQDLARRFSEVAQGASAFLGSIEKLPFDSLRDISFDAAANLIKFAGGLDSLNSGLNSYFENFYTEQEKFDLAAEQIGAALSDVGLAMPDVSQGADEAKAAFRTLFESLDTSTEEGQRAAAAMLAVNDSFAQLAVGLDEIGAASRQAAEDAIRAAQDAARAGAQQRAALQTQIWQMTGDTVALRDQELAAIESQNRPLQEYIYALQDHAQAVADADEKYRKQIADYNALAAETNAAWQVVQQVARRDIERLQETFTKTDSVYRALSRAVDAQRTALDEQARAAESLVSSLRGVVGLVRDSVRELRGQTDSTAQLQYEQAMAVIRQAAGGSLSDNDRLSEAIQVARGVTEDPDRYASSFERDFAMLSLANELERINATAEPQLTVQEQQLEVAREQAEALQEMLAEARRQIDILRGLDDKAYEQALELAKISVNTQQERQLAVLEGIFGTARDQVDALLNGSAAQAQAEALRGVFDTLLLKVDGIDDITDAVERSAAIESIGGLIESSQSQLDALRDLGADLGKLDTLQGLLDESKSQFTKLVGIDENTFVTEKLLGEILKAQAEEELARSQIDGINSQLALGQQQLDALNGIRTANMTMVTALNNLASAMNAQQVATPPTAPPTAPPPPVAPPPAPYVPETIWNSNHGFSRDLVLGKRAYKPVTQGEWVDYIDQNADLRNAFLQAVAAGGGVYPQNNNIHKAYWAQQHWDQFGIREDRRFARGGLAIPGWALVGEEGPELVNFSQTGRVYTANQTNEIMRNLNGGNDRALTTKLAEKIDELVRQNERLEARLASIDESTGQMADQFDNVSAGGNAIASEIMNKVEVEVAA